MPVRKKTTIQARLGLSTPDRVCLFGARAAELELGPCGAQLKEEDLSNCRHNPVLLLRGAGVPNAAALRSDSGTKARPAGT